ncbi:1-deoxy-D-xylulose-5-phosphate reductoisomerase [Desulfovibrio sp. OttesenSCG-928-G15]|nr:1-deoxy-D-xylulose-5-phosphate reductoisomerase [Desulfovibrio sp. OttesenSCG-928-G15]
MTDNYPPLRYISPLPSEGWLHTCPRTLALLGSTGSIGRSALDVIRRNKSSFRVAALAGAKNLPLLAKQAGEFLPQHLAILDKEDIPALRALLPRGYKPVILVGQEGFETLATLPGVHTVLSAQVGAAGLRATWAAVCAGKVIALANKESLVLAGDLIREACARTGACILPVDSEHNAIFQCISGQLLNASRKLTDNRNSAQTPQNERLQGVVPHISRLLLTASGGPFFGKSREELAKVTAEQALAHPNWDMGAKITIDSATLMNKGLEIIEAAHLYGLPLSRVDVLVHRESIIHSLVEFTDGSQMAQLGEPDMRVPIAYCLGFSERLSTGAGRLDLTKLGSLTFAKPDTAAFPCLALAQKAQEHSLGSPVILNAANEIAVEAFLDGRIGFADIPNIIEHCLASLGQSQAPQSIDSILLLDAKARIAAREYTASLG